MYKVPSLNLPDITKICDPLKSWALNHPKNKLQTWPGVEFCEHGPAY